MTEHKTTAEKTQAERARIHAALGEETRLAIVDALAYSDRRPGELAATLRIATNLLAHHLHVLEEAGLLRRTTSRGDARRKYLSLQTVALHGLLAPPRLRAQRVLFVCTHNSARSQLASALWNKRTKIPSESAGVDPAAHVHPLAARTASRHGLDLRHSRPRSYEQIRTRPDLVISVCDRAREALPPFAAQHLHWSVPDPVDPGRLQDFEEAFRQISHRIEALLPSLH